MSGYDPGWNDPPKMTFNPENPISKPRNLLNKRVPFSMNGTASNESAKPSSTLPPVCFPPSMLVPNVANCNLPSTRTEETVLSSNAPFNLDSDETMKVFEDLLNDSSELGNKLDDVKKRLCTMETMWKEGKLNEDVKRKTYQLAKVLKTDPKAADLIHKTLMVDHTACVSPWMVGIKRLIMHWEAKLDLLNIEKEETKEDDQ